MLLFNTVYAMVGVALTGLLGWVIGCHTRDRTATADPDMSKIFCSYAMTTGLIWLALLHVDGLNNFLYVAAIGLYQLLSPHFILSTPPWERRGVTKVGIQYHTLLAVCFLLSGLATAMTVIQADAMRYDLIVVQLAGFMSLYSPNTIKMLKNQQRFVLRTRH